MTDSPYIFNVTEQTFDELVIQGSHEVPVLVDFWADWCNPCRMLMPLLAKLVNGMDGKLRLAKVNTEEQRALAARFGVRSLPTVKLFRHGEAVDEFMGALPESDIRAFLERHIPRESDALIDQAQALLAGGRTEAAQQLLAQVRSCDPDNPRLPLTTAEAHAAAGNLDDAIAALNSLPLDKQDNTDVKALRARINLAKAVRDAPETDALQQILAQRPGDSQARYQLANRQVIAGEYEAAMDNLIALMQKDRNFQDHAARNAMLAIFDMLGANHPLVPRYRQRLFNVLH